MPVALLTSLCRDSATPSQRSSVLQGPAAALLALDCSAALGDAGGRARLSTLGAAMLSAVLRFDKVEVSS